MNVAIKRHEEEENVLVAIEKRPIYALIIVLSVVCILRTVCSSSLECSNTVKLLSEMFCRRSNLVSPWNESSLAGRSLDALESLYQLCLANEPTPTTSQKEINADMASIRQPFCNDGGERLGLLDLPLCVLRPR